MKFNRRTLLLRGLGAGVVINGAKEQARLHKIAKQQNLNTQAQESLDDSLNIMDAAYASEAAWDDEVKKRKELLSANSLSPPSQPYDRAMSKRLIQLCKLSVQQYKTGRANPNYDGSINLLPAYRSTLQDYTQPVNFTIEEEIIEDYFKSQTFTVSQELISGSTLDETIGKIELTLHDKVRQILQRKHLAPVYSGIFLASEDHNVLVFRGTQTQAEWLKNINAKQEDYISLSGQFYGKVHKGFLQHMRKLQPVLSEVAQQLDPTIPCYVTGHSLGAAIATLVAFELANIAPQLQEQIQLYTFAGPRVASPAFAKIHNQLVPNAYRIVNQADTVPLIPPVNIGTSYVHVGQKWCFLAQLEDTLLNHVVDTYQVAIEQEVETDQIYAPMQPIQLG